MLGIELFKAEYFGQRLSHAIYVNVPGHGEIAGCHYPTVIAATGSDDGNYSSDPSSREAETDVQEPDFPHVIVVEDNDEIRLMMQLSLDQDFNVDTAATFDDALDQADTAEYDIFLIDIDLGESRNGIDLLKRLREAGQKDTPMIACTAYALPGDRERFINEGFDGYLGKPFTRAELLKTLKHFL